MVSLTLETEEVDAKGRGGAGHLFSEINSGKHWVEKQAASPQCVEVRVHTICFLISKVWHDVSAVSVQRC